MADNILRLKVESSEYDQKLKKAAEGIRHLAEVAHKGGGELTGLEKAELDYIKSLGTMETKSRTAAGSVRELESTFKELTVVYNHLNDVEKQDEGGKALRASLDQIKQRAQAARAEIEAASKSLQGMEANSNTNIGGGLFSGLGSKMEGALAVFGGNLMTKAAGAVAQLGSEMADMVKQGIEMAKQGEGIRIAFERLGRGDILDGLREATHGTITDLELMKAAVKFNDFKLPIEELGTMLAFAQQKAKDTGQSIDYMTESLVTGLGRKSLMILDNLGLSANEIKEKMKETGDMTKAVGAIIREQMAKAGDYVETAADRAAQANVSLQNKMEELGRKFGPVEEASSQLWTSMKIAILDIVGGPLARLLNSLTEAGRLKNALNDMNGDDGSGNTKVGQQLKKLQVIKKAGGSDYIFNSTLSGMMEDYNRQIMELDKQIKDTKKLSPDQQASKFVRDEVQKMSEQMKALGVMRDQLAAGAKEITNPKPAPTTPVVQPTKPTKPTKTEKTDIQFADDSIMAQEKLVSDLTQKWKTASGELRDGYLKDLEEAQKKLAEMTGKAKVKAQPMEMATGLSGFNEQTISAWTAMMKSDLQKADLGSATYFSLTHNMEDMSRLTQTVQSAIKLGLDVPQDTVQQIFERIFDGENMPADMYDSMIQKFIEDFKERTGKDLVIGENGGLSEGTPQQRKDERAGNQFMKKNDEDKYEAKMTDIMSGMAGGIQNIVSGLNTLGFEIPAGLQSVLGGMQAISSILSGIAVTVMAIEAIAGADAIIPFANGGIVPAFAHGGLIGRAAGGMMIPGNSMSGDRLRLPVDGGRGMVGINSGELILNRAQQGIIASELEGGGMENIQLDTVISAEDIRLVLNNNGRRTGRGEYVQTNRR